MTTGTKSLLFGVHQFAWHPFTVLLAWIVLYKKLPTWRELLCIIMHDWGYWGKAQMDDEEGERHPELAARIAAKLLGPEYRDFCLFHSRHYARRAGKDPSLLCWADKLSLVYDPWWFYLPRARMSGELREYRRNASNCGLLNWAATDREWYRWCRERFIRLAKEKRPDVVSYYNQPEIMLLSTPHGGDAYKSFFDHCQNECDKHFRGWRVESIKNQKSYFKENFLCDPVQEEQPVRRRKTMPLVLSGRQGGKNYFLNKGER